MPSAPPYLSPLKQRLQAEGLCIACRGPRGADGTTLYCRRDADKRNKRRRGQLGRLRQERRRRGECTVCGERVRKGSLCAQHRIMQSQADSRYQKARADSHREGQAPG